MLTRRSGKKKPPSVSDEKSSAVNKRTMKWPFGDKNKAESSGEISGILPYDVLTIIFKKLTATDLLSAARVCRLWSTVAKAERLLRERTEITSLCQFKDKWTDLYPANPFVDGLKTQRPMLRLIFTRPFDDRHPAQKYSTTACPSHVLPWNCPNIIVGNYGIIKDRTEMEDNTEKAACLIFPQAPGVSVRTVLARKLRVRHSFDREVKRGLRKLCVDETDVKCLIVLSDQVVSEVLNEIPRDDRIVCGGVAENLAVCKRTENNEMCCLVLYWIAILISGPSVQSWSVVLTKQCRTKEKVEAKLNLLRDRVKLRKHYMGFMFACQGRGEAMFGEKNVEATLFKKVFPKIPLVGSFGGGEYGECTIERTKSRILQYSTVFMILTYGPS